MKNTSDKAKSNISKSDKRIFQIYDRMFKRLLTLSSRIVIALINSLFKTSYLPDSKITYNWTEHTDDELERTVADVILTVNNEHAYHMEAQMYPDEEIEFRVFDYGYKHALTTRGGHCELKFPEPYIIFLYKHDSFPDNVSIFLNFGTQGTFEYKVPSLRLLEYSPQDLEQKDLLILLPFMLLKLRPDIEKERTPENMEALRSLIFNDIMGLVQKNQEIGNITAADAAHLLELTRKLYNHLYARYKEFVEGGFNDMIQDELVLETDIIIAENTKKVREELKLETDLLIAENTKKVREHVKLETDLLIAENTKKLREEYKAEKDAAIAENTRKLREEFKLEIDAAVAANTKKIQEEFKLEINAAVAENTRKIQEESKLRIDAAVAENTKKIQEESKLRIDAAVAENTKKIQEESKLRIDAAVAENTKKIQEESKLRINAAVAENTKKIQEELLAQQQLETIRKLYSKLGSINQVSELLEFPIETIQLALK